MQALGLTGLFASRVFLPMFAAAVVMRFGPDVPIVNDLGLLDGLRDAPPTWFTANGTLLVLGVLAAAEVFANKVPEARELLNYVDQYGKPAAALATYVGIASVTDQQFIEEVLNRAGVGDAIVGLFVAGGAFVVASAHNAVFGGLIELDEDDDTGIVGLFSWAQDVYALFGTIFLILFPIVMGLLILAAIGVILYLRRRAEKREEQSKIACPSCQQPMYLPAIVCGACGAANPSPTRVNWLGVATREPVIDREQHPYVLVTKKRCRRCATRLEARDPHAACPACAAVPFDDPAFVAAYDRMVMARLPLVLLVCVLLSLVPVIGLIPGVIVYRMALVAPFRRYIGRVRTFALRWGVRLVFLLLIAIQWMPGVGGVTVPAMALISYLVYRGSFMGLIERGERAAPVVAAT